MDTCIYKEGFVRAEGRMSAFSSGASEVCVAKGQECLSPGSSYQRGSPDTEFHATSKVSVS